MDEDLEYLIEVVSGEAAPSEADATAKSDEGRLTMNWKAR